MDLDLALLEKQSTNAQSKKQIAAFLKHLNDLILDIPYNIFFPGYTAEPFF